MERTNGNRPTDFVFLLFFGDRLKRGGEVEKNVIIKINQKKWSKKVYKFEKKLKFFKIF